MADKLLFIIQIVCIFLSYFVIVLCTDAVIEYHEDRKSCTYFQNTRYVKPEFGLVNCTWYNSRTCCKRTEVTSVFTSNMLPLYRASTECHNRINYLMCFFCSPDQYLWYKDGRVHVCESFCLSVHTACQDAYYDGTMLGDKFQNGTAFCEAQDFKVVNSKNCFKYDPTVFGSASLITTTPSVLLAVFILQYLLCLIS